MIAASEATEKVIETARMLLPGSKIIKLKGYSRGNKEYSKAKHPVGKWRDTADLTAEQVDNLLQKGYWIGATIPTGRMIIDIDEEDKGALLKDLLEGEGIHHHAIKTPHGYQFIFAKGSEPKIKQVSKFFSAVGIKVDTKPPESGYVVWPTENTEGRFILTQSLGGLAEIPQYLHPVWNSEKTKDYDFPIPFTGQGSRNNSLFEFARRLHSCGVPEEIIRKGVHLIYEYFIHDKSDFPVTDLEPLIDSVLKLEVSNKPKGQSLSEGTHIIPNPYKVMGSALYKQEFKNNEPRETMVARHVPIIKRELHNVERPQVYYELAWNDRGKPVSEIVPAGTLAIKKELMQLADKGFACNDNNAKQLIDYFDKVLAFNEINQGYMVDRIGHIKKGMAHPLLAEQYDIIPNDQGDQQLIDAFKASGSVDDWVREVFDKIKNHPVALFFILSSFASILLHDLKIDPFIVDLTSSTSKGKTTTLKIAASVWGTDGLVNEFNATKNSIERKAALLNSFPVLLDDSRKADEKHLQPIIYSFSGGKSKGRSSLKGSQRELTWKNIMLTTGENPLNEYTSKAGGAAARVISLTESPFGEVDFTFFSDIHLAIDQYYGTVGLEFMKEYQKRRDKLPHQFQLTKNHYLKKAGNNEVLARLSLYYATVHYAGRLLKELLGIQLDLRILDKLFDEVAMENKAIDKPKQILEEILNDLDSSRNTIYYDQTHSPNVMKAIYKFDTICLMPAYLKEKLGVEEKMIRKEWLKRGITESGQQDKDYRAIFHKGKSFRAIVLNKNMIEELGFNFKESS